MDIENEKRFTQEEVNQIVSKRLSEEKVKFSEMTREKEAAMNQKIKEAEAVAEAVRVEQRNDKQARALLEALKRFNAVNPEEISKILKDNVSTDNKGNVVFKNSNGEIVPVEKGVEDYLNVNLWAVKDMQESGSGFHPYSGHMMGNSHTFDSELRGAMGLKDY